MGYDLVLWDMCLFGLCDKKPDNYVLALVLLPAKIGVVKLDSYGALGFFCHISLWESHSVERLPVPWSALVV